MKIIDLSWDGRINGYCVTAVCSYEWYIAATDGAEENLKIQRSVIKGSKAYQTLRADLRQGCVLPPLVLAISEVNLPTGLSPANIIDVNQSTGFISSLQTQLSQAQPSHTFIIDGLQRTNALRQTSEELEHLPEEKVKFLARPLRLEIWLNISFGAIAYRMLLLNAGQKPLPMKHQIEVLSMKLKDDLASIPNIEILTFLGAQKRTQPGQFILAKLAKAFQAWLQGSPHIDFKNAVMEQLLAATAVETLGTSLSVAHDDFKSLVGWFVEMDKAIWTVESEFFANETVPLAIAAAVGSAQRNDALRDRMKRCMHILLQEAATNPNVLATDQFYDLRQGEDARKVNVGEFSRDMIYRTFQEYFISDGTKPMKECWAFGASQP